MTEPRYHLADTVRYKTSGCSQQLWEVQARQWFEEYGWGYCLKGLAGFVPESMLEGE